jgi:hypothetical protein
MYTLGEVIREALDELPGASVHDIVNWIRMNHRQVIEDNFETISYQGLSAMVRAARKIHPRKEDDDYAESLCFDFGLPPMAFDKEISVPRDMDNLTKSVCDWPELEETTVRDFDKHIKLLIATGNATLTRATDCQALRDAAMQFSPNGDIDVTIGELRRIAQRRRGKATV